jgi:hypothetical protein
MIGLCPVNKNILAPKYGALSYGLILQNDDFLENGSNNFD